MPERYLGQTLGKYRIESLLGTGGFAWVFKGYDPELDIPVAVKVLKPQYSGEQPIVERFRREASTAARLRHPNIVKIYAVGREGDAVYFVMDYLPGGLADRLETTQSLPEEYVLGVGIDVARALGFAHREGVIHRDIKVDNILFDSHGNAIVADFGIARALSGYTNQTGTNMVVGTPQYFAPEQARAKPLDGRADIYSLGVTLFRAATGRLPFEGEDWYEIARQHVEDTPPSPRSINPALSPEFEAVVLRCMAKSADDRPPTGEVLGEMLQEILRARRDPAAANTVTVSPPAPPPRKASRPPVRKAPPSQRSLLPAAVITTVVVVGLAALIANPFRIAENPQVTQPDSIPVVTSPESGFIVSPVVAPDSGTKPPAPKAVVPPARDIRAQVGSLVITAPADARVTLNDSLIGTGSVRRDSLAPGDYVVRAVIPSLDGCLENSRTRPVRVRAGTAQTIQLNPVACGSVSFRVVGMGRDEKPVDGVIWYALEPESGTPLREVPLPLAAPMVLPAGRWTLRLRMAGCAPYSETFEIVPGVQLSLPTISLVC